LKKNAFEADLINELPLLFVFRSWFKRSCFPNLPFKTFNQIRKRVGVQVVVDDVFFNFVDQPVDEVVDFLGGDPDISKILETRHLNCNKTNLLEIWVVEGLAWTAAAARRTQAMRMARILTLANFIICEIIN